MACTSDASLRIVVSGIMKRTVRRDAGGIVEERDLGSFFRDAGCKVAGVRLVIDAKRRNKTRGFAFVDFEDPASLNLAQTLHNKEAKGLADKDGKLRIEKAHATTDEDRERQRELSDAMNQTDELERKLEFQKARLNGLVPMLVVPRAAVPLRPPGAFELPARKQSAHTAIPNPQDAAESTANDQGDVASQKQHNIGATQGSGAIAALPAASFEPPAREQPAHTAIPNPQDAAGYTGRLRKEWIPTTMSEANQQTGGERQTIQLARHIEDWRCFVRT